MVTTLSLDLVGIKLALAITGYQKNSDATLDEHWCNVELSLRMGDTINYRNKGEFLHSEEIEELRDAIGQLLSDEIKADCVLRFIEPDIEFELSPKSDIRDNPSVLYIKPGVDPFIDISMDMRVYIYHEGYTANYLSVAFDREDIKQLWEYLVTITQ